MELSTFETRVSDLTREVWLISESEYPFSYVQTGIDEPSQVADLLAKKHQADVGQVKVVTPESFLSKIEKNTSSSDSVIVANTQKIKKLLDFLQQHLEHTHVYRIETGVSIPVYILGYLPGNSCVGVSSTSIET
jgi:hypothetical protein